MKLMEMRKKGGGNGINSQSLFNAYQLLVAQTFNMGLDEMIDKDMVIRTPNGLGEIKSNDTKGIRDAFKLEEIPETIKQTMLTSTGTQKFYLNEAAADYFGGAGGAPGATGGTPGRAGAAGVTAAGA